MDKHRYEMRVIRETTEIILAHDENEAIWRTEEGFNAESEVVSWTRIVDIKKIGEIKCKQKN